MLWPDTRAPASGPGQLGAQVTASVGQSEASAGEGRPMRGRGVTQRPALATKRVFKARPGRVCPGPDGLCYNSAKTHRSLSGSE